MQRPCAQMLLAVALGMAPATAAAAARPGAPGDTIAAAPRLVAIVIEGSPATRASVIRRCIGLRAGDRYDPEALRRAQERLEALDFIEYAAVRARRPSPNEVVVVVWVAERERLGGGLRLDYERRYKLLSSASLSWSNVGGFGDEISLRATGGYLWRFALAWRSPCTLPARVGIGTTASWERAPFVFEPFRLADRRVRAELWRDLGLRLRATCYYEYRSVVADRSRLAEMPDGESVDPALGIEIEHDSRDLPAYPRRGLHLRAGGRRSGLGGGGRHAARYDLFDADGAVFLPIPGLAILAGRARWRGTSRPVPVYERLFLGGPGDLRGIGFGTVRGDEGFLATVELRRPLWMARLTDTGVLGLGVHAFRDWGKAWDRGLGFDGGRLHRSWGLGLDLELDVLNLRCEWARAEDRRNTFQFEDRFTF